MGNLSFKTGWKLLKDHFHNCGYVESTEVMKGPNRRKKGPNGRKKGFGTVSFSKKRDTNNTIRTLNGMEIIRRDLEVRFYHKG